MRPQEPEKGTLPVHGKRSLLIPSSFLLFPADSRASPGSHLPGEASPFCLWMPAEDMESQCLQEGSACRTGTPLLGQRQTHLCFALLVP